MPKFLRGRIFAPMGSFGTFATGPERPTAAAPTRSQLIGLLGAALGVKRHDKSGQDKLAELRFATEVIHAGSRTVDFHTFQSVKKSDVNGLTKSNGHALSRSQLFRTGGAVPTSSSISTREYRSDILFKFAVWSHGADGFLQTIAAAINQPVYHLYLGRKSCPIAAPILPQVVHAESVADALDFDAAVGLKGVNDLPKHLATSSSTLRWEPDEGIPSGVELQETQTRHDAPLDRTRWTFGRRIEAVGSRMTEGKTT